LLLGVGGVSRGLVAAPVVDLQLVQRASGFVNPVYVTHAGDGGGRLFVLEQSGVIRIIRPDGTVAATPLLSITDRVLSGGERGLLGLAFHPSFVANRWFYVYYTRRPDGASIVSRFEVTAGDPDQADPSSEFMVLGPVTQPQSNHNAGMIEFGPDGLLYIALGDGGGAGDTGTGHTAGIGNAQDPTNLLGSILRIDINSLSPPLNYSIPPDNPFVGNTMGRREEIYAWGLRNPWRFAFDSRPGGTNRLFTGDVGQNTLEEIDIIIRGGNYGWRCMEGTLQFNFTANCAAETLLPPIHVYGRSDGISVTGGYVYRGEESPNMTGLYIFGDFGSGRIWALEEVGGSWERTQLLDTTLAISSFGEDEGGEIYLCAYGTSGAVYKLVDAAPTPEPLTGARRWALYD